MQPARLGEVPARPLTATLHRVSRRARLAERRAPSLGLGAASQPGRQNHRANALAAQV